MWGARVRAPWRLWERVIVAAMAAAPKWWWPEEQGTLGDGRTIRTMIAKRRGEEVVL